MAPSQGTRTGFSFVSACLIMLGSLSHYLFTSHGSGLYFVPSTRSWLCCRKACGELALHISSGGQGMVSSGLRPQVTASTDLSDETSDHRENGDHSQHDKDRHEGAFGIASILGCNGLRVHHHRLCVGCHCSSFPPVLVFADGKEQEVLLGLGLAWPTRALSVAKGSSRIATLATPFIYDLKEIGGGFLS